MNVLSLFDGISCAQVGLQYAGVQVEKYYASEIDTKCIEVTQNNFPKTIQLGDINNWRDWELPEIDLLIGGSPCQGFSSEGKMLNFNDKRSALFFVFLDILREIKPKHFIFENVVMSKKIQDAISFEFNCEPVLLNSNIVSAQDRPRNYWTNIPNVYPTFKYTNQKLSDILEFDKDWLPAKINARKLDARGIRKDNDKSIPNVQTLEVRNTDKSFCLTTIPKGSVISRLPKGRYPDAYGHYRDSWRHFTQTELERLQTLPEGYTDGLTKTKRESAIGNGFTAKIIAHIIEKINTQKKEWI